MGSKVSSNERVDRCSIRRTTAAEVAKAIGNGILVRSVCEICGDDKTDAHHDDYTKPLSIRWLCRTHHKQWHGSNTAYYGESVNKKTTIILSTTIDIRVNESLDGFCQTRGKKKSWVIEQAIQKYLAMQEA